MTRAEFVDFVRATFNARDMITPAEGAAAVEKAFAEYEDLLLDVAEGLWVVLANTSGARWHEQSPEWQTAAMKARDRYHAALKKDV